MQLAGGGMPTSTPFFLVCVGMVLVNNTSWLPPMGGLSVKYPNFLPWRSLFSFQGIAFRVAFDQPYRLRLA
jgi:hypothetical protein